MKAVNSTLVGIACALTLSAVASTAAAGHQHGGYFNH